jgi:hypothetical protein
MLSVAAAKPTGKMPTRSWVPTSRITRLASAPRPGRRKPGVLWEAVSLAGTDGRQVDAEIRKMAAGQAIPLRT